MIQAPMEIDPLSYPAQIQEKLTLLKNEFSSFELPELEVFESQPLHYRMRAEFRIWHRENAVFFAMNHPGEKSTFTLEQFPPGSVLINQLMKLLLPWINESDTLRRKLFSIEFLTTLSGEAVVTLIYHRKLDEQWLKEAEQLHQHLGANIIGRSRKQKLVVGVDYVLEKLEVDGKSYCYQQVEGSFTQPNAGINEQMLGWAQSCAAGIGGDLLELYCGNGNFTCVLAQQFNRVLATEISKTSVRSAARNLKMNEVSNAAIVRMASEEITQALNKVRPFRRMKDIGLDNYRFSTVFVDPPRAGLDAQTEQLVAGFDNILYISCNPRTLKNNLEALSRTHAVQRFAVFDQFPYTPHLECGVWLTRRQTD